MTEQNGQRGADDELALAESALKAAQALLDLQLAPDAASRTYYAALHAARALLLIVGVDARSHRAVRTLLSQHFVKSGALEGEHAKHLAQLEGLRSAGDYDASFAISADELRPELEKARAFVARARTIIAARVTSR